MTDVAAPASHASTHTQQLLLHREQQVLQLSLALSRPYVHDVLVYGPACTGKTSIVRQVLAGRPHAYVSCCRALKLRSLLSSVLAQLAGDGKRKRAQAFAAAAGTEHGLIWELKAVCPQGAPPKVLVLDEMQQLLAASDGPLGPLLQLREQAGINLALILVTRQQPAAEGLLALLPGGVLPLACPAYSDEQLVDILAAAGPPQTPAALAATAAAGLLQAGGPDSAQQQQQQLAELYTRFLGSALVPQFHRLSRCLPDLACQAGGLWPKWLAGATSNSSSGDKQQQQQRGAAAPGGDGDGDDCDACVDQEAAGYSAVQGRLEAALRSFQPAACCTFAATTTAAAGAAAGGAAGAAGGAAAGQQQQQQVRVTAVTGAQMAAGLELSRASKLLLISAFLASRNKPSVDRQLFGGPGGWRGGSRRRNVLAADRQAEAAKVAELRGPHTFGLSRLLTIYANLLAGEEEQHQQHQQQQQQLAGAPAGSRQHHAGGAGAAAAGEQPGALLASAGWMGVSRSDVLMVVNNLVAARLMTQASDDPLDGPRFGCEAASELIEALASDQGVQLTSYLKYV